MNGSTLFKTIAAGVKAHKPEIMVGLGIAAGAGAIFAAVKETPACLEAFEKAEAEQPAVQEEINGEIVETPVPLDFKTKALIYLKHLWPVLVLEGISIFLIVDGTKIRFSDYTALAAIYGVTKAERDDLKKIIAAHPENWKKKFAEKGAEMHLGESDPKDIPAPRMSDAEVPMALPLFWDDQAKVYFRMSEEELRDAVADFTHDVTTDPFQATTINSWMERIHHEDILNGEYLIMTGEDEFKMGALKYQQIGVKEAPNGEPARMMKFSWDYHVDMRGLSISEYNDI